MASDSGRKEFRLLNIFTGIFVSVLVLIPSMASKMVEIGPFVIVGGTLVFPITFIFNDILTEVYGYARSRRVIWTGLGMQVFAAFFYHLIDILPAPDFWTHQEAYHTILGQAPRIAAASLLAYFFGEFANSVVMSKMKYAQKGETGLRQGWRFLASTIVGEGLDSVIFLTVAFYGIWETPDLVHGILSIWCIKVAYEAIVLPVSIPFANWVKKVEGIDAVDQPKSTSYNPFKLK